MKICFFVGDISKTGGTERVTLLIANELSKKHEVSILSFQNGDKTNFEASSNITLSSLHMENAKAFWKRKILPYTRLLRYLTREKIDILINVDVILCLYSLPIKALVNTKMVAWEHFNFRNSNGVNNRSRARKLAANMADQIVVLTKEDLEEYQKNLKIKHKVDYIYNPTIQPETLPKNVERKNIVIASGRLAPQKNFTELLKIWSLIEKNNPSWNLVICGSGEEEIKLKKIAKEKKLKNVVFAGFVQNVEEYYQQAKIMVMTSRFEGFPMVLLEGQNAGLPIVAYDCFTGPKEIVIDGKDGYLIELGNKAKFASSLEKLMRNEELREKFSLQAMEDAKRFNIKEIAKRWEDVVLSSLV
ncbi:hypothetical protein BTI84_08870 [Lactobacillus delbrueckii subsp. bulgaricus]|nr:hypothetical protein [Lactobacillus delbrueckii subsp. bulgaricus]MBT9011388.1 hypothetical protein [Lactobacillus delbrueckii subsp. bulgaricus]MBT9017734.1 hypothetical protein [Lactobacillus delbrueckii subsp. bulgaricus]